MAKRGKLRVPVFSQPKGSGLCMPTALRMVLAYHGDHMDLDDIVLRMGVSSSSGSDSIRSAIFLLRRGYGVRIVGWSVEFPPAFSKIDGPIARDRLLRWARRKVDDPSMFRKACRQYGTEFFRLGGVLEPRPCSTAEIRAALRKKQPPIAFVNVTTLWHAHRENVVHAVVPLSADGNGVVIIDPAANKGVSEYDLTSFLHAFYRSEGEVLFISPKR